MLRVKNKSKQKSIMKRLTFQVELKKSTMKKLTFVLNLHLDLHLIYICWRCTVVWNPEWGLWGFGSFKRGGGAGGVLGAWGTYFHFLLHFYNQFFLALPLPYLCTYEVLSILFVLNYERDRDRDWSSCPKYVWFKLKPELCLQVN